MEWLELSAADQVKAARAGISIWLAAELGYSNGRARGLAQEAKRLGSLPQLSGRLAAGELNQDQTRILARAVKAAAGGGMQPERAVADTLRVLGDRGVGGARAHVRVLEEMLAPGHVRDVVARQRARCFLRVVELAQGMVRIEVVLDAQRGTVVRAGLDRLVAGWVRSRRYDEREVVAPDVVTIEQFGAQALTRLAEVFFTATDRQRAGRFTAPTLYLAPARLQNPAAPGPVFVPEVPVGCARTVYGDLIPADTLAPLHDSAARTLTLDPETGAPVSLDGRGLDTDPQARLASPEQRIALAFRDRECSEPGCARPSTWSLYAHHLTAYRDGGETRLGNLTLLCSEHHVLRHHPDHHLAA